MDIRPDWDEYFLGLARHVSTRSTCLVLQVGAVIVVDRAVVSCGYNGAPRGMPHCDGNHNHDGGVAVDEVHAEANALVTAARHGTRVHGGTLYTTHSPCLACFNLIANAGIGRVVYTQLFRDTRCLLLANGAGISLEQVAT
jgi:dCMP deaminase